MLPHHNSTLDLRVLSHNARSNAPPSESDERVVRQIKMEVKQRQATRTRGARTLSGPVETLHDILRKCDMVLSPLRRFPLELLGKVIRHAVMDNEAYYISNALCYEGPWAYSQVSSLWRSVTLSLHELWARIDITNSASTALITDEALQPFLQLILARSGSFPLHIAYHWIERSPSNGQTTLGMIILKILFEHANRWSSLDFELPEHLIHFLAKNIPHSLPILRSLVLEHCRSVVYEGPDQISISAPMLEDLQLHKIETQGLTLSSHSLTSLTLCDNHTLHAVELLLQSTEQLEVLRVYVHPEVATRPQVKMPRLRELDLQYGFDGSALLSRLYAPALTALHGLYVGSNSVEHVVTFQEQTNCIIHALSLDPTGYGVPALSTLFARIPTVKDLTIRSAQWHANMTTTLLQTPYPSGEMPLPNISSFTWHFDSDLLPRRETIAQGLSGFLDARIPTLQRFQLKYHRTLPATFVDPFAAKYRAKGLEVTFPRDVSFASMYLVQAQERGHQRGQLPLRRG